MDELLDNVDIKIKDKDPKKFIKWFIYILGAVITISFSVGYYKHHFIDRFEDIEYRVNKNEKSIINIKKDIKTKFNIVNKEIDNIYDKSLKAFEEYKIYTDKQLSIIIEFGQFNDKINKDLLKKTLDFYSVKYSDQILQEFGSAKREYGDNKNDNIIGLPVFVKYTDVKENKTVYIVEGAPHDFLDTLNTDKYNIIKSEPSKKYHGLFDFTYATKPKKIPKKMRVNDE